MGAPLSGSVIMITGASSGIGEHMARQLASSAKLLILVARRADRLETLANALRSENSALAVEVRPCDLSDIRATEALATEALAKHGAVDVLINNAGLGDAGLVELADWTKVQRMLAVNIDALTLLTRLLLPAMVAQKRGGILNVSSGFGMTFMPGMSAYCGTKHFVTAFTEGLRLEMIGTGVVVSQVCPGPVKTEFEDVAGNPLGRPVPEWIQLSAAQCAQSALRGFQKGRALIVPGAMMKLLLFLGAWTPRWVFRLMYRGIGPYFRKKQSA